MRYLFYLWNKASPDFVSPYSGFNRVSSYLDGSTTYSVGLTYTALVR